jgi:hypothetical protein
MMLGVGDSIVADSVSDSLYLFSGVAKAGAWSGDPRLPQDGSFPGEAVFAIFTTLLCYSAVQAMSAFHVRGLDTDAYGGSGVLYEHIAKKASRLKGRKVRRYPSDGDPLMWVSGWRTTTPDWWLATMTTVQGLCMPPADVEDALAGTVTGALEEVRWPIGSIYAIPTQTLFQLLVVTVSSGRRAVELTLDQMGWPV